MQKIIFKSLTLLFTLFALTCYSNATDVPGYIVNENTDTVYGTIRLSNFNPVTGGLILSGFNMEAMHYNVSFKRNEDNSFRTLLPATVLGFEFTYDSEIYSYKRFLLKNKSIITKERQEYRFLHLVYKGNLDLYQNVKYINNPSGNSIKDKFITLSEYFLFSNQTGLLKVEVNEEIKTIRDLLRKCNMEEQFIRQLLEKTKFKDIQGVLEKYDNWLRGSSDMVIP